MPPGLAGLAGLDLVRAVFPGRLLQLVALERGRLGSDGDGDGPVPSIEPDDPTPNDPEPGGLP